MSRAIPYPVKAGFRHGVGPTVQAGALLAVLVFSTTYRLGGVFLYPRLMIAAWGFYLVMTLRRYRELRRIPLLVLLAVIVATVSAAANADADHLLLFIGQAVRGLVLPYFAAIACYHALRRISGTTEAFVSARWLAGVACAALLIQAFLSIVQVTTPDFREAYLATVNLADSWRQEAEGGHFRYSGIGGISLYDTAISYCLIAALLLEEDPRERNGSGAWLRAAGLAALVLLGLLHGRTGLAYGVGLILVLLWREWSDSRRSVCLLTPRIFVIFVAAGTALYLFLDEALRDLVLGFAGELFISLAQGQGLRSDSTDDFFHNHLRLPELSTIIGGHAYWAEEGLALARGFHYSTDSGFLLLLNYGGAPLLLVTATVVIAMLVLLHRRVAGRCQPSFQTRRSTGVPTYLVAIVAVVTWKGPIYFSEHCMSALYFVVIAHAGLVGATARKSWQDALHSKLGTG